MRAPTIKEVLLAAFTLVLIGWASTLRKLNSPGLHVLEHHSAVPLVSLSEKHFPHHLPNEGFECFTLINNGFYDLFLAFNAFEISEKHGSRMIGSQNAMVFPVAKDEGHLSAAYQFCVRKELLESHVILSIIHFEAIREKTTFSSAGTAVNASAFCLCPPQTTMAIQDKVKRELIYDKCKDYEVFFHNSNPGFFCDPEAGKKNNQPLLRGPGKS